MGSFSSIYQKDPALFDEAETPDAKPEAEQAAFIEDLARKRKFFGGEAYENSRTPAEKESFGRAVEARPTHRRAAPIPVLEGGSHVCCPESGPTFAPHHSWKRWTCFMRTRRLSSGG